VTSRRRKFKEEIQSKFKKKEETSAHDIKQLIFKKIKIVSGSELSRDSFEPGPHIPR
jgi:hypothetical protein